VSRYFLALGYAAALGLIAWLGILNGWLFGMACICLAVIVHLAIWLARSLIESAGWPRK